MNTFHFGAHRTASSSTQMSLVRMADAGDLPGWRVFGPRRIRHRLTRSVDVLSHAPLLAQPVFGRVIARDVLAALDDPDAHCILSDENLLGPVDPAILGARGLYPDARRRLLALHRLIGPTRDRRVVLAVRNYADWWPSAYAMMSLRRAMPAVAALKPVWLGATRRWPALVRTIMGVFGECDVLCYEALKDNPLAHLTALVGDLAQAAPQLQLHTSFSADALELINAQARKGAPLSPEALRSLRREDRNKAKLDIFTTDERRRLTDLYLSDLDEISDMGARICVAPPARLL